MKVLITVPDLSNPGGVSALYNILKLDQFENIEYFNVQGKKGQGIIFRLLGLMLSYLKFFFKCFSFDIIHINPSLNRKSFLRDAVFAWITILLRRKLIVYWHGWEIEYEESNIGVSYVPITSYYNYQPVTKTFEYLMSGLPVIATATYENKLIINQSNGILIEDNPKSFCEGLIQMHQLLHNYDDISIKQEMKEYQWKNIAIKLDGFLFKK